MNHDSEAEQYKAGNEFLPYHPSASHVNPDYRDGWNDCYRASIAAAAIEACQGLADAWAVFVEQRKGELMGEEHAALMSRQAPSTPDVSQEGGKGDTWQPISTAPRDGTAFFACLEASDIPHAMRFHEDGHLALTWDGYIIADHDWPTHWMPLPQPPHAGEGGANG